jgi:hypothetical protein
VIGISSALSAFKGALSPKASENDELLEPRVMGRRYRRSGRSKHTFVFRSYALIVESDEADLMRDVCFDMHKAQVKLKAIRRQIAADREHAAAREKLLTSAENRLSAAIVAARDAQVGSIPHLLPEVTRAPAPLLEVKQRRANSERMARRRDFNLAMRQRIRDVAASRGISDDEIRPALTLKHEAIGRFSEARGVNLGWLLEGRGASLGKTRSR